VQEDIKGLAFINLLRRYPTLLIFPDWINITIHPIIVMKVLNSGHGKNQPAACSYIQESGFIAQEVEQAVSMAGIPFSGVDKPSNPIGLYGLRYADFVVPLVKAVQELSAINLEQEAIIASMKSEIERLNKQLEGFEALMNTKD
jgi:hypothetical protein